MEVYKLWKCKSLRYLQHSIIKRRITSINNNINNIIMIRIAKYALDSKEQAESKIKSLGTAQDENGNEYPTHKHTIVQLGNIVLEQGQI
jgi:hypothetical protein